MSCHGADKKGTGNFPAIIEMKKKYSSGSFDTLLQSGRRMMPAFKHLDAEERKAIASFLLEQKSIWQKKFIPPPAIADDPVKLPYSITGYNKFLTSDGLPAISPPWGTLNALHLGTGQYTWKKRWGMIHAFPVAGSQQVRKIMVLQW